MQQFWRILRNAALGILVTGIAHSQAEAAPSLPKPFTASYAVSYRGINGGTLTMQWRAADQPNHYVFETRVDPTTLASLFISGKAFERTTVEIAGDNVRPVLWEADDGKSGDHGDGRLEFDWSNNTVAGTYEGKPVSLPLQPGTQDRLSIQISVMTLLLQGREPGAITFVNGDNIREYTYTRGKTESVASKIGTVDTVIYESTRPNSNRLSRFWHVPSLDYIPVRLEQVRKGKVETVMELVELKRDQ